MRSRLPLDIADLGRTVAAISRNRPDSQVNGLLFTAYRDLSAEAARAGVATEAPQIWEDPQARPTYAELHEVLAALSAACAAQARSRPASIR